jgi:hypothetical protein
VNPNAASTKYVHDVHNSSGRFELLVCRNRKVGPGIFCRCDVEMWSLGVGPKVFTSLAFIRKQESNRGYASASHFDITVKVHILLIVGIILYF